MAGAGRAGPHSQRPHPTPGGLCGGGGDPMWPVQESRFLDSKMGNTPPGLVNTAALDLSDQQAGFPVPFPPQRPGDSHLSRKPVRSPPRDGGLGERAVGLTARPSLVRAPRVAPACPVPLPAAESMLS